MGQDLRLVLIHPALIGGKVIDARIRHLALADHIGAEQGNGNAANGRIQRIGEHLQNLHKGVIDIRLIALVNGPQPFLRLQILHSLCFDVLGGGNMLGKELRHRVQALVPPQHHAVLQMPHQGEYPDGKGNQQQHISGKLRVEPGHFHAAADKPVNGCHDGKNHTDHRACFGNIVDHAGDQGRGLAALHFPHRQMENLVPQQFPGPEGDLLNAVLAADIAPHGDSGVEDGQQGIADDDAVVKLAFIDLDHIL